MSRDRRQLAAPRHSYVQYNNVITWFIRPRRVTPRDRRVAFRTRHWSVHTLLLQQSCRFLHQPAHASTSLLQSALTKSEQIILLKQPVLSTSRGSSNTYFQHQPFSTRESHSSTRREVYNSSRSSLAQSSRVIRITRATPTHRVASAWHNQFSPTSSGSSITYLQHALALKSQCSPLYCRIANYCNWFRQFLVQLCNSNFQGCAVFSVLN